MKDVTAGMADKFISYLLQYDKTDQKTFEKVPLVVSTVRSIICVNLWLFCLDAL